MPREGSLKVSLITPAPRDSRAGNRTTAVRWARILRSQGHRVAVGQHYRDEAADLMIALHAYRSAASIQRFRELNPGLPLIVALTGTDIYHFIHTEPTTLRSMELADRLVGLHEAVLDAIPERLHAKLRVIFQSARPLRRSQLSVRHFDACVIGHLREEKDPLRAALAARLLPAKSRVRVTHLGRALDSGWEQAAREEMAANPRYRWLGELPHWRVRQCLGSSRLMVLTSKMEGGANVVSEAVAAGTPVISSLIPGSIGLLGKDYPGYFPAGDAEALARLLFQAEQEPAFYALLQMHCDARRFLFSPEREAASWQDLLRELT
jgi:putative glycosyltransferase (TIGR04348 family)